MVFGKGWRLGFGAGVLALLAACATQAPPGAPELRRLEARVVLSEAGPAMPGARFDLPARGARDTVVTLGSTAARPLAARLSCDGAARLQPEGAAGPDLYLRPGAPRAFRLPSRAASRAEAPRLLLPEATARCVLDWGAGHRLELVRPEAPAAAPACTLPGPSGDPLGDALFAERDLVLGCVHPVGTPRLLPDETAALQFRLEKLTGAPVSRAALALGDPEMALDFSRAPRFDEIIVSYLQVRADISGRLVTRALAHHASRGTRVRIAVADSLTLPLDRRMLEDLASRYPSVEIQYVRLSPEGFAPLTRLWGLAQVSHHIKIFAGRSPEPGRSFAIVGGRNMHDMFFYPDLETRPRRPDLHDYGDGAQTLSPFNYFTRYEDFEMALVDAGAVADISAQFDRFWRRDACGTRLAPGPEPRRGGAPSDGVIRHFLSLPCSDGRAQEGFFVDLIDAAAHEIVAVTPFFYPTPAIDAALMRAVARGVRVRVVTRFVSDEPTAIFINALTTEYADRRGGEIEIVNYVPETRLLHTKIMVIDDRLSLVTSTNLNRRSFTGDSENGFVALDRALAARLKAHVEGLAAKATPYPADAGALALGRALVALPGIVDLF